MASRAARGETLVRAERRRRGACRFYGGVAVLCAGLMASGCAQIVSRSTVEIVPRTDATPLVIGPPGGQIDARGVEARWSQDGDRLALSLAENRTCLSVRHVPVTRIERVVRKTAAGAMWFEYGLGAGALALGLSGLIVPERFSQASVTVDGQTVQDKSTGYRIGGIFTGLGAILLTAAVVDTVRTRDEVVYTDAYRRDVGGTIECRDPRVPMRQQTVELLVDEWSTVEPTGADGKVRFLLPAVGDLPAKAQAVIEATATWDAAMAEAEAEAARVAEEARAEAEAEAARSKPKRGKRKGKGKAEDEAAEDEAAEPAPAPGAELGPRPEPMVVKGVLRIDDARALAVDFVVPYDAEMAQGHTGEMVVMPTPVVDPRPRSTGSRPDDDDDGADADEPADATSP